MSTESDAEHEGTAPAEASAAAGLEVQHTFVFADLAGFTALTEAHGDQRAVGVIQEFTRSARELLPTYEAEQVKTIGDALMLRSLDAAQAVRLGVRLVDEVGAQHGFPGVRVGIHTGPAIRHENDYFGATVNLAARVAAAASAGEVLLTGATRDATKRALEGVQFRSLGTRELKNVAEPVELFTVLRVGEAARPDLVSDPVCRMVLDPTRSHHHTAYHGTELYFCSALCQEIFATDPQRYGEPRRGASSVSSPLRALTQRLVRRLWP